MKVSTDMSLFLWQGRPCERFGMLANSPSCFVNLPEQLMYPAIRSTFMLSKGWTVNNAGISLRGWIRPHYLTRSFEKMYIFLLHPLPDSPGVALSIFIEGEDENWEDNMFRRVALDSLTWTKPSYAALSRYWPFHSRLEEILISRIPLTEYKEIGEVRGIDLKLYTTKPVACTALHRDEAACDKEFRVWPAICETASGILQCCFEAPPHLAIGILGHVVLSIVESIEVLICLGLDDRFRLICFIVLLPKRTCD